MKPTTNTRTKKYTYFIGVDISRNELDFAVCQENTFLFHAEIKNEKDAILEFVGRLKAIPAFKLFKAVFCMENTGFYGNHLLHVLVKIKASIVNEHPLKIKNSIRMARGKDDKTDAIRIAEYAWKNRTELELWSPKRAVINELAELMALRSRLLNVAMVLKTPQKEKKAFMNTKVYSKMAGICEASIDAISTDLMNLEQVIKNVISGDENLSKLMKIITSVPYIGFVTGTYILIYTNEYKDITDPKKFACYAGIAPFPKESGLLVRRRRLSSMANKRMKSLLHICAAAAATRNAELNVYYKRKLEEGKPKLAVINAVRYKLVLRVFACLKQDRLFIKKYERDQTNSNDYPSEVIITETI